MKNERRKGDSTSESMGSDCKEEVCNIAEVIPEAIALN